MKGNEKMKKILTIVLIACLVVMTMAACGGKSSGGAPAPAPAPAPAAPAAPAPAPSGDAPIEVKIGFAWHTNTDVVFGLYSKFAREYVDQLNAEGKYKITLIETSAENDSTHQMNDVESLVTQQVDAILLAAVDMDASASMVDTAVAAGIPVVNCFKATSSDKITSKIIAMDHYYVGTLFCEWLDNWMNENPDANLTIALINGNPAIPDSLKRGIAFEEIFVEKWKDSGRITYLGSQNGEQRADLATNIAEDWFQTNPEINCWVSSTDMMTFSIYNVAKSLGRDDILYVTGDATADVLKEIEAGNMQMTLDMDKITISQLAVDTCIKVALGEPVDPLIDGTTAATFIDTPKKAADLLDRQGMR